jgi:ParB family chromosome partitioning protein
MRDGGTRRRHATTTAFNVSRETTLGEVVKSAARYRYIGEATASSDGARIVFLDIRTHPGDLVAQQRRGLGKGLGALIPEAPRTSTAAGTGTMTDAPSAPGGADASSAARGTVDIVYGQPPVFPPADSDSRDAGLRQVAGAYFEEVAVGAITPNPRQPRRNFDEEALEELSASITEVGLLQPVVVRKLGQGSYELVMGERRWRASQQAGLEYIPAIVRETPDTDMLRDALLENLHRQQLNPLEEAAAYQQLLDDFGATHEQLAQKVGRSRPHISNTLRLLDLPPTVQKRLAAGTISAGHARALLSMKDHQAQERLADRIVAEGLSVRSVEEIVMLADDKPEKPPRKPTGAKPVAPALRHLSDRLSDLFETRVKVEMGRHKGKITVEFATIDDLERIVKAMSPEAGNNRRSSSD